MTPRHMLFRACRIMQAAAGMLLAPRWGACAPAWADEPTPEGKWRGNAGLSASCAAGNTRSSSLALSADAARHTENSKISLHAQALATRAETTAGTGSITSTTVNQRKGGAAIAE